MPDSDTQRHTLKGGRTLAYIEVGDPLGFPIFYAHGGPRSRLEGALFDAGAATHGFRLIATERPGMGRSTFLPNRRLLDYPKDIAELADALSIDRSGVTGWSGGGAHTTVCAYALPERLAFTLALAGYTNSAELPGAVEMVSTKADRASVGLSQTHPRIFQLFIVALRLNVHYFPGAFYKASVSAVNESDKAIIADPVFKDHFLRDQREAVR